MSELEKNSETPNRFDQSTKDKINVIFNDKINIVECIQLLRDKILKKYLLVLFFWVENLSNFDRCDILNFLFFREI